MSILPNPYDGAPGPQAAELVASERLRGDGRRAWHRVDIRRSDNCTALISCETSGRVRVLAVEDLSMGGLGALLPRWAGIPLPGEAIQLELSLGGVRLQMWSALAWSTPSPRGQRLGLFFRRGPVYQSASIALAGFLVGCLDRHALDGGVGGPAPLTRTPSA